MRGVRKFLGIVGCFMLVFSLTDAGVTAISQGPGAGSAWNLEIVGHHDLGERGYNADVWVYNGYAYVGQWGFGDWAAGVKDRFCPQGSNTGVVIIDVPYQV